jgi:hypothetical protein
MSDDAWPDVDDVVRRTNAKNTRYAIDRHSAIIECRNPKLVKVMSHAIPIRIAIRERPLAQLRWPGFKKGDRRISGWRPHAAQQKTISLASLGYLHMHSIRIHP